MALSKSKKMNSALASIGIFSYADVLSHLPRRYENYAYTEEKVSYEDKEHVVLKGKIRGGAPHPMRFAKRTLYRFYFETVGGMVFLIEAWNRTYLGKMLKPDTIYTLTGVYEKNRHTVSMVNILSGEIPQEEALKPIYSLPSDIQNFAFVRLVKKALLESDIEDVIPEAYRKKYRLLPLKEAYRLVHMPRSFNDIHQGMRTLKYQEALLFEIKNQEVRAENKALRKDRRRQINREKLIIFVKSLPYSLSNDQQKALDECVNDMDKESVMYRLLQGDVGTGKTLVAALCGYANYTRSEQTALRAPTDSLARQHYETLKKLF